MSWTKDDGAKIAGALYALGTLFEKDLSPDLVAIYEAGLEGLTAQQIQTACRLAIAQCKFMPRPVELRELAGAGAPKPAGRALLALAEVRKAIRDHGRRGTFDFRDPLIHACVRTLGGWTQICNSDPEWTNQKWVKTWDSLAGAELPAHVTAAISGGEPGPVRQLGPIGDEDPTPTLHLVAAQQSE